MSAWKEVTRHSPCQICGKTHWCCVNELAGVLICMRAVNEHPKTFRSGDVGYVYTMNGRTRTATYKPKEEVRITINCSKILSEWHAHPDRQSCYLLSKRLGVGYPFVAAYDPVYSPDRNAWAFPMRDAYGNVVGIRLRNDAGRKWAVTGSRQGLFIPKGTPGSGSPILVCEGPTSSAAGHQMGFFTVGTPSAGSGVPDLAGYIRKHKIRRVVIVADNKVKADASEDVGVRAAERISKALPVEASCVLILPAKDLRDFLHMGGDHGLLNNMIESSVWNYAMDQRTV